MKQHPLIVGGGAFPATKHVFSNTKINLEIKDKLTLNSLAVFVTRKSVIYI